MEHLHSLFNNGVEEKEIIVLLNKRHTRIDVVNKYKDEINTIFCVNELKNKNIDYSLHISDDS